MSVKEVTKQTLGKNKVGWVWDRKRSLWSTWEIRTTYIGAPFQRRGFISEAAAKQFLDELKIQERLIKLGIVSAVKFPTLADAIQKHIKPLEGSERQRTERVLNEFLALCPANATVDQVERKHIKDFCDKRIAAGVKPQTANREINCISSMLNQVKDNFTGLEKWSPPDIYRPQMTDDTRDRVLTDDEREKIVPYLLREIGAGEREKDYLARRRTGLTIYFGLLTGLRHGEICGLERINFDRSGRKLKAERFKTRKSGVRWTTFEPLTPSQLSVLDQASELYPDSPFIFSRAGKIHGKFYEILEAACAKFKIPYGRSTAGGFVMHDTRHTFVTALEHAGTDSSTTRSYSGHSRDSMLKRYAHATPDSRARAMRVIEDKFGPGGSEMALNEIYEAVRSGALSFAEFEYRLSFIYSSSQ